MKQYMKKKQISRGLKWVTLCAGVIFALCGTAQYRIEAGRKQQLAALRETVISVPADVDETVRSYDDPFQRTIDWNKLRRMNPDIAAWLYIPGTGIDYPVLSGDKYLYLDEFQSESPMGSIFMDGVSDPDRDPMLMLFGHNMRSGLMFGGLKQYLNASFATQHAAACLYTETSTELLTLISAFTCSEDDEIFELNPENQSFAQLLPDEKRQYLKKRSAVSVQSDGNGQILSLSTCYGHRGTTMRMTVHFAAVQKTSTSGTGTDAESQWK